MDIQLLQQSLVPAKQETTQSLNGDETRFLQFVGLPKIKDRPEIDLRNALKWAMVKVGLRGANFPKGLDKSLLLTHIFENYGNHTPDEIRLAFDLAVTGKLSLDANEVNCYESFSCLYFSKIMNAYRIWANQVYEQHKKTEQPQIEHKPDIAQIEKEYQEFLQTDLGKQLNPKI
jgi:hypothetical protein